MNLSFTEQEMLESKQIMLNFDFNITQSIAQKIGNSRIIFTGMGSSLIFPGKQAKNRALKFDLANKVGAYFASDLFQYTNFSDTYIFLCSNSGKTKEVILLLDYVKNKGAKCVAVTAVADSILAQRADEILGELYLWLRDSKRLDRQIVNKLNSDLKYYFSRIDELILLNGLIYLKEFSAPNEEKTKKITFDYSCELYSRRYRIPPQLTRRSFCK